MVYSINWHFREKTEFSNGWQLLWQGKKNQDIALKKRNELYKQLIKALKPQMIADGRKPNKTNTYHYWDTPIYKEIHAQIDIEFLYKWECPNNDTLPFIKKFMLK